MLMLIISGKILSHGPKDPVGRRCQICRQWIESRASQIPHLYLAPWSSHRTCTVSKWPPGQVGHLLTPLTNGFHHNVAASWHLLWEEGAAALTSLAQITLGTKRWVPNDPWDLGSDSVWGSWSFALLLPRLDSSVFSWHSQFGLFEMLLHHLYRSP